MIIIFARCVLGDGVLFAVMKKVSCLLVLTLQGLILEFVYNTWTVNRINIWLRQYVDTSLINSMKERPCAYYSGVFTTYPEATERLCKANLYSLAPTGEAGLIMKDLLIVRARKEQRHKLWW